jgi:hypothetical protein
MQQQGPLCRTENVFLKTAMRNAETSSLSYFLFTRPIIHHQPIRRVVFIDIRNVLHRFAPDDFGRGDLHVAKP